jgi:hypothetical protein
MATILDTSLLGYLMPVFIFLLIWAVTYGLLTKIKFLGDNNGLHAIVALSLALLVLIQTQIRQVITLFLPWVFLLGFLTLLLIAIFMFIGVKEKDIVTLVKREGIIYVTIISVVIILFFVALSQVFGPFLMVTDKPGFWEGVKRVLLHPRILGAIFILVVAAFLVGTFDHMPMPGKK